MDKRYIQLYSIRDELTKDFEGTLKNVAKMGYTGVEFASGFYGGYSAADLKKMLADIGLDAIGTHIMSDNVAENLDYVVDLGLRYVIDPMAPIYTWEEAKAFCEKLNAAGKLCKDRGIIFGYHNHHFEFLEGKDGYLLETLLLNTDPDLVCFQLDVGWATYAGVDAPSFIKKYPGRFKLIHVKECAKAVEAGKLQPGFGEDSWNVATGKGIVDWPAVRDVAVAQGAEAFIVEREFAYAGDIFSCVAADCEYLKSL